MTSSYFENKPRPKYDPIPSWLFQFIPEQYIWLSFLNKNFIYPKVSYFCSFSEELLDQSEKIFANNLIILNYENFGIKFKKFCPYKWDYFCQYTHLDWLKMCKKYCDPDLDLSGLVRNLSQTRDWFQITRNIDVTCLKLRVVLKINPCGACCFLLSLCIIL